jgi:hypothetical protein
MPAASSSDVYLRTLVYSWEAAVLGENEMIKVLRKNKCFDKISFTIRFAKLTIIIVIGNPSLYKPLLLLLYHLLTKSFSNVCQQSLYCHQLHQYPS